MRASFYECDITPPLGGFMWGYYCQRYSKEVFDRLYARAAVIEDNGNIAAFVVVDTCVIPPEMHDIVTKRIEEYTGIKPENVCICSDHSHTGAPVFDGAEVNAFADEAYKDVFFRLCADAVILAYKRLDSATAKYAKTEVKGHSYNRNFINKSGKYVTQGRGNPEVVSTLGEVDYELPIIFFERDSKPIGAIISYALHQDTVGPPFPGYSGDYSCILAKKLKEQYGQDFVTVFLIGTCGDVNHIPVDLNVPIDNYKIIGESLAKATIEAVKSAEPIGEGVEVIKEFVEVERRPFDTKEKLEEISRLTTISTMRARNMLFYISSNPSKTSTLALQGIRIGDVFIAALPGEIYTTYGKQIKAASPFARTIVAENCNSYCGYIPSHDAFDEKSNLYESSLCYHSCYVPETGDMFVSKVLEFANKLAKK